MTQRGATLMKISDEKAMKSGVHRSIHWVKKKLQSFEQKATSSTKNVVYETAQVYNGDWKDNQKHGFGLQTWSNGNKYEGEWACGKRNGSGTFWAFDSESKILKKQYHGVWKNDFKEGLGVFFYMNGDRYEGLWERGMRHGQGSLFCKSGDMYMCEWVEDKRCGWGTLTKANGDQYEGQWLNNQREGQGQIFYRNSGKVFDGEWVHDMPKCGVYTDMQLLSIEQIAQQLNPLLPTQLSSPSLSGGHSSANQINLPELRLANPDTVLSDQMHAVQRSRAPARSVPFIALDELFTATELDSLRNIFGTADASGEGKIKATQLKSLLEDLALSPSDFELAQVLIDLGGNQSAHSLLDFSDFVKAIYLLQAAYLQNTASTDGVVNQDGSLITQTNNCEEENSRPEMHQVMNNTGLRYTLAADDHKYNEDVNI